MIEQTASALNLSSDMSASPQRREAASASGAAATAQGAPLPGFAARAANENGTGLPGDGVARAQGRALVDAARLAAEALAREKARTEQQRVRVRERRRWLMLLTFILALLAALSLFSEQMTRLLPGMAHVYARLGLPVALPGYEVRHLRLRWVAGASGQPELAISGIISNVAGRPLPMPRVALALVDDAGAVLYRWRIPGRASREMVAGAQVRFRTRLAEVPALAAGVRLTLTPR